RVDERLQLVAIVLRADELGGELPPRGVGEQRDKGVQAEAGMPNDVRPGRSPPARSNHARSRGLTDERPAEWAPEGRSLRPVRLPLDHRPEQLRERPAFGTRHLIDPLL